VSLDGKMRFFADHNIPESVCKALENAGHVVVRLRHKTAPDSPDTLVAAVSEANDAILITMDGDFKTIASRIGIGRTRFKKLSLLRFEKCRESRAADRVAAALSLVEHEWKVGNGANDRRMFVVICTQVIRTHR
jgi:predicted nuclease of predicted toxin-antitoxin system